ncbi:MAG: succinate-semialdehyde dehydrogenase [Moraxellaceae bacterium]|jgi:succinate-semialdehyde dehydrogenase/glutarate-semialdehyde dehydrogenase|nr:succinate-semialdehyde dehydrogenase [Moraxellaceae bacterium]
MMLNLKRPDLLRTQALVNGQWCDADGGERFVVTNPATGEEIAGVPRLGAAETARAIAAADSALPAWRARTGKDRAQILRRWYQLMMEHQEDLARILTFEQGKSLAEARGEVAYAAAFIEWFGEEAKRVYGDVIPGFTPDRRLLVLKQPVGVVAAITPWNFPIAMITRKVGPALAAGCTVVVKPASETPLSALAAAVLAIEAGVPAGVLNVVTGSASVIGPVLTGSPIVRKLSFTGSTEVGRRLMAECAPTLKKMSLELGGNAPFIVFDDANLDSAVAGALASKFRNSGQTCVCTNRILVQDAVHDAFVAKFAQALGTLKVGAGWEEGVNQGPLINEKAVAQTEALLRRATEQGARIVHGGGRHERGGLFFQPTLVVDVSNDSEVARNELFAPIATIIRFRDEAEAIQMANATEFGLASYFYSQDINRIFRVSEALEYGIVGVNEGIISTEVAPFGGMKASGMGREGSRYGIEDYLEIKYVCIGNVK